MLKTAKNLKRVGDGFAEIVKFVDVVKFNMMFNVT